MKKFLILILIAVFSISMIFIGVGCKDKTAGETTTAEEEATEETTEEAAEIMAQHKIRRIPVIKNDHLIGFVALADIAVPAETVADASLALHQISEPRHNEEQSPETYH